MRGQSPAAIASRGAIHEPPTIGTLGSARYSPAKRSSIPPVGQKAIPANTGASARSSATPPSASAGKSFMTQIPSARAAMISEDVATPGR